MTLADGVALGSLALAFGVMGIKINGTVIGLKKDVDEKVRRNYKRLDEVKLYTEQTYTRKDICSERHEQIQKDLTEIKSDVKKLLTKNGIK